MHNTSPQQQAPTAYIHASSSLARERLLPDPDMSPTITDIVPLHRQAHPPLPFHSNGYVRGFVLSTLFLRLLLRETENKPQHLTFTYFCVGLAPPLTMTRLARHHNH